MVLCYKFIQDGSRDYKCRVTLEVCSRQRKKLAADDNYSNRYVC